jgi:TRAP transporter TAXI family solute receptor
MVGEALPRRGASAGRSHRGHGGHRGRPAVDPVAGHWFLLESVERLGRIRLPESASRPGRAACGSRPDIQGDTQMRTLPPALAALLAGLALSLGAQAQNLSIATGGTGGVYYPLGGGIAAALSKHVPGMQATAEVTGGSVDNLKLIGSGKPYIALTMVDATLDAYKGEDKFKGNKVPVRTLMILYPNRMHVVSIEGRGVNKMSDLKGKRVSTGSPGSATEVMAFRVIEAAGLDKDSDMKRERLGVAESVNAVKDGKIDAFFWVGGLPTAAVTDLANTPGTKIKMIDHADTVAKMNQKYGNLYVEDAIPKAMYKGMDADNKQATVMNILVAHETMDDKTAYNIVKTIFDKRDDLIAVHKEAENFKLENQKAAASPIPFHPGAVKYFAEKGIKLN